MSSSAIEDAIKITSVIRKHVDEENCKHSIKEIAAEAFEDPK